MADDTSNISDLTQVKQLTASIRFESEEVRHQVEQMLTKYQDVADILGKTRELTKSETALVKDYLATVSRLSSPMAEHLKGLNESSRALVAMEQAASRYTAAVEKSERVSARMASSIKDARKEQSHRQDKLTSTSQGLADARGAESSFTEMRSALQKAQKGDDSELRELLGGEAEGKTKKGVRRLGGKKFAEMKQEAAGPGASGDDAAAALRATVLAHQKNVDSAQKEFTAGEKRIEQLKRQKKIADQLAEKNGAAAKASKESLAAHEKLLPKLQKRMGLDEFGPAKPSKGWFSAREAEAEDARRRTEEANGTGGGGGSGRGPSAWGRRGLMNNLGLNVLSDMGVPGVSEVARVERYRRMSVDAAEHYKAKRAAEAAENGEEGGGGFLSKAAGMLANPLGLAVGGAAVIGGFGVHKFRQAMGDAESMAGPQRVLQGQGGSDGLGAANAAYRQDLTGFGIDMRTAQQSLIGLNRQVGARAAPGQLRDAAAIGQGFGQDVNEVGGQAGALLRAGGSSPTQSVKSLEKIMIEGVRAGMDRARITEFTSEVVSIQEQILRESGANNAQAIARSLSQLMGASGKQGSEFFQSAGFQGLQGINRSMQGFARGASGMGSGTLYRAFAPGVSGGSPADKYVNLMEKMEGGLFGGNKKGDMAADRTKQVLGQYFKESGAGDLFDKKAKGGKLTEDEQGRYKSAENVVRTRMQMEMGVGFGQSKELLKIMENIDQKMSSPEGQKEVEAAIKDMQAKTKDPLVALGEKMSEANNSLSDIALSAKSLRGFRAAKDVEIGINKAAKPVVEAGADLFADGVKGFGGAVKSFQDAVTFMGKIFGADETTPEQKQQMDDTLRQLTGKGLDEFKNDDSNSFGVTDLIKGFFGMFGTSQATKPTAPGDVKYSDSGVPMTPEMLKALLATKPGDKEAMQAAVAQVIAHIKENTNATHGVGQAVQKAGRSGNIGGAAARQ